MRNRYGCPAVITFLAALAAGCGGGGGGGDGGGGSLPQGSAEGLWNGTSSNGRTIAGIVLDDGQYWFIYSLIGNNAVIAGAVQGSSSSRAGNLSSSNGKDFNFEGLGVNNVSVSGTYAAKQTLAGRLVYQSETVTFNSTYDPDYDSTPSLANMAGTFTGSGYAGMTEYTVATISTSGAIAGQSASGCRFTGTAAPRSRGNVYNVSVTFQGAPCANGTNTLSGVGYFDSASKQLISAALNSNRTNGFIFVGTKP